MYEMRINLPELFAAGINGTIPGAILGFVLATGVAISNELLFVKVKPITFQQNGSTMKFSVDSELNKHYKFTDDLRALEAYKEHNPRAYNRACAQLEKLCSLYKKYRVMVAQEQDTTAIIAKFQLTSMNADLRLRQLFQSIKSTNDAKDAEEKAMNIHLNCEEILAKIRDELTANFTVPKPRHK